MVIVVNRLVIFILSSEVRSRVVPAAQQGVDREDRRDVQAHLQSQRTAGVAQLCFLRRRGSLPGRGYSRREASPGNGQFS